MEIASTLFGLENILKQESKGKIIYPGRVLFNKGKLKSALLTYDYIKSFYFKDENEVYKNVRKIKFKIDKDFRVDCSRIGKHNFSSQDMREKIGEIIYNKKNKVNLTNPKTIIYVDIIDNFCIIGKNPKNIGKRDYKIRISNDSLNACLAYSLLRTANFNKNKSLIDPFCSDGTLLIEAALLGGKKLYGFSQDIKNASINSKIAKVKINLSDKNLDWLDTLFKKNSVDLIISKAPFPSKRKKMDDISKVIKELFHRTEYILKKNGLMLLVSPKTELLEKYAKLYNFKVKEELKVLIGSQELKILSFKKVIYLNVQHHKILHAPRDPHPSQRDPRRSRGQPRPNRHRTPRQYHF